jgi:hypothetical protein
MVWFRLVLFVAWTENENIFNAGIKEFLDGGKDT